MRTAARNLSWRLVTPADHVVSAHSKPRLRAGAGRTTWFVAILSSATRTLHGSAVEVAPASRSTAVRGSVEPRPPCVIRATLVENLG